MAGFLLCVPRGDAMRRILLTLLLLTAAPAMADVNEMTLGGDVYVGGSGTTESAAERDLFVAGGTVTTRGTAAGDGHFAGFDVGVETEVAGDVYAAGGAVTLRAPVGEDVTAMGMSVGVADSARVGGNARLMGGSVVVEGPVAGSLLATGGEVLIDAEIAGDVRVAAGSLSFGPRARIGGRLDYAGPEEVAIPASVIDPARVTFTRAEHMERMTEMSREWGGREYPGLPGAGAAFGFLVITIGFFVALAAIVLALAPERVEAMRREALARPGVALLGGVVGLSTVFGLIPVAAMTIVGIPIIPVVLLAALILWTLGYAFGVYVVALRVWTWMGGAEPAMAGRLGIYAAGILLVALLNVVPFAGWALNFTLVLFGIGALAVPVYRRLFARAAPTPPVAG
jgi:cytoskeletal protein CcmA (bactofilin family)